MKTHHLVYPMYPLSPGITMQSPSKLCLCHTLLFHSWG